MEELAIREGWLAECCSRCSSSPGSLRDAPPAPSSGPPPALNPGANWGRFGPVPSFCGVQACRRAGLDECAVVSGRGPFSVAQNRQLIRRFGIGVLVTKDSGAPGGLADKLEAAAQEKCQVVVVDRPNLDSPSAAASIAEVVRAVGAP